MYQNYQYARSGVVLPLIMGQSPFDLWHGVLGHVAEQLYHL